MRASARTREMVLAGAVVAVIAAGLVADVAGSDVGPPPAPPEPAAEFTERALFCPPGLRAGTTTVAMASPREEAVAVGLEPHAPERVSLPPGRVLLHEITGAAPLNVVGLGSELAAGAVVSITGRYEGIASTRCARTAAQQWHFAEGSSALGFDQRLWIYNPFPDEAVVRVGFLTPVGEMSRAALANIAVSAGQAVSIRVNDFILRRALLGAIVKAERGRVVAWRVMLDEGDERPGGASASLGTPEPSDTWYFPGGGTGDGIDQRIAVLNPGGEEATVTVSVVTAEGRVQPPQLTEVPVPPRSAVRLRVPRDVGQEEGGSIGTGAIVQAAHGNEIVAERTVYYSTPGRRGVTSEVGVAEEAEMWLLAPAALEPSVDYVTVLNAGAVDARVTVALLRKDAAPERPDGLVDIAVPAGTRVRIPLLEFTGEETAIALLTSDVPVTAERFAYETDPADAAAVIGTPLTNPPR